MIVTCPSCETSFAVDEALLGERGRKVRCSECAHRWHQMPEPPEAPEAADTAEPVSESVEPVEPPAPEPEAEPAAETPPPVRGPKLFESEDEDVLDDGERRFALLGWAVFLVVFALIAGGFYFGQQQIVAFEPRFQKLYDLVGLQASEEMEETAAIPGEGLSIPAEKLLQNRKRVDGQPMIVVEGIVVNETGENQPVPSLRATVANADGNILARWYFSAAATEIAPGTEVSFGTSIKDSWGRQPIGISIIFVSDETVENEPSILPSGTGG